MLQMYVVVVVVFIVVVLAHALQSPIWNPIASGDSRCVYSRTFVGRWLHGEAGAT